MSRTLLQISAGSGFGCSVNGSGTLVDWVGFSKLAAGFADGRVNQLALPLFRFAMNRWCRSVLGDWGGGAKTKFLSFLQSA